MKNLLQQTKQSLLLVTLVLTSTTLPLTTAFAADIGNVNNTSAFSSTATVDPSTSVAPDVDSLQSSNNDTAINLSFVTVGDPGNIADPVTKLGSVSDSFQIAQYDVTAAQYVAFLNAVAWKEDPHGLYNPKMGSDKKVACITRSTNDDGTFSYDVISGREKLPITYVSLNDAERFCNWLHNGAPTPSSDEAANTIGQINALSTNAASSNPVLVANQTYVPSEQSTESGAYKFSADATGNEVAEANSDASYFLPSQDQWVKAAYYKGNGVNTGYWMYPTQHDTAPNSGTGDVTNLANYKTYRGRPPEADFLTSSLAITTVDCFSNTVSFYKACGMAGNIAEWTTSTTSSGDAVVRGGSWASEYNWYYNNDLMRTAVPKSYDPSVGTNFIGFRVAVTADALPVSLVPGDMSALAPLVGSTGAWTHAQWKAALRQGGTALGLTLLFYSIEFGGNIAQKMPILEALSKFSFMRNLINVGGILYPFVAAGDVTSVPKGFLPAAVQGGAIAAKTFGYTAGAEVVGNAVLFGYQVVDVATAAALLCDPVTATFGATLLSEEVAGAGVNDTVKAIVTNLPKVVTEAQEIGSEIDAGGKQVVEAAVSDIWTLGKAAQPYLKSLVEKVTSYCGQEAITTKIAIRGAYGLFEALNKFTVMRFVNNVIIVGVSAGSLGIETAGLPSLPHEAKAATANAHSSSFDSGY